MVSKVQSTHKLYGYYLISLISEMSKILLELVYVRNIWWPEDFHEKSIRTLSK